VVRRLIRRAIRQGRELGIQENFCARLAQAAAAALGEEYPGLVLHQERLYAELDQEETKFKATLERGLRQVHKTMQRVQDSGKIPSPEKMRLPCLRPLASRSS
jgi:alanyl-tRNA synthetase